jgi:hypothetical protein
MLLSLFNVHNAIAAAVLLNLFFVKCDKYH